MTAHETMTPCAHPKPTITNLIRTQWCSQCGAIRSRDSIRDDEWGPWQRPYRPSDMDTSVAWIEIVHSDLHCTCGHITESRQDPRPDGAVRTCGKCKKQWFAPAAGDCEPHP